MDNITTELTEIEEHIHDTAAPDDKFSTVVFLPEHKYRKGEGGLRTKGCFKKSLPEKPLISVVTVVFNGEKYLEETIQSVLNQTYSNIEYIIIDGGSTDGTIDIIRKFEDTIDYWVSEPDKGIYDAMNKGICCATGVIVGLLNCGDFYNTFALSKVTAADPLYNSVITGNMYKFSDEIGIGFIIKRNPKHLKRALNSIPINHPSTFVPIAIYKRVGLFDPNYRICGDNELIFRIMKENYKIVFLEDILTNMRMGGISESFRSVWGMTLEHHIIRKKNGVKPSKNMCMSLQYFFKNIVKFSIKATLPVVVFKKYYAYKNRKK